VTENRPGDPVVGILQCEQKQALMKTLLVLFLSITTATAALAANSTAKKVDQSGSTLLTMMLGTIV
jgi:hypothetical protein